MFNEDFDFDVDPFEPVQFGKSLRRHTINHWVPVAVAAITAAGMIASSLAQSDPSSPDYVAPVVLPKTVSGNVLQDLEFLFDQEAAESMKAFTANLTEWGEADRTFFETQFQPFQQDLINTNQALLPVIERNASEALNQNIKDLLGSEHLKESFRKSITDVGGDVGKLALDFAQQIENIPGEEQRVGEAVSQIEQTFGQAGAELKRSLAAKGVGVSEASKRDLLLSKASAKAGAVSSAAEAARMEKLQATAQGVGVLQDVQTTQANMLSVQQQLTQTSADLTPQVGGVQDIEGVSKAGEIGADMTQSMADKMLGQSSDTSSAEFVQPGVVAPVFMGKDTKNPLYASGEEYVPPPPPVIQQVQPRYQPVRNKVDDFMGGGGPGVGTGIGSDSGATGGVGVGPGGGAGGQGAGGSGDGGSGGPCFPAGSLITTFDGVVSIEDVKAGDKVLSYNIDSGLPETGTVGSLRIVEATEYFNVMFKSEKVLRVTADHPMYTVDGWASLDPETTLNAKRYDRLKDVSKLGVGSGILNEEGVFDVIVSIDSVPGVVTTYTLENVLPCRNFFVEGYLASNRK